jgi:hypothetical protein
VRATAAKWVIVGASGAAILALSPALSAVTSPHKIAQQAKVSLRILGSIGSFTPVTRDERLARAYADAARESQTRGFRFTPASGGQSGERSLTVLVRATSEDSALKHPQQSGLGVAPVAYSIGKGKGLDRFIGDSPPVGVNELKPITENVQMPKSNFTLQPDRNRFSTNLQLEARDQTATPPTSNSPQTLGQEKSYGVDLSSSYSLTRHLDVQAGVRYRGPDNRLVPPLTDQAKDSQAVYVGTKFKF